MRPGASRCLPTTKLGGYEEALRLIEPASKRCSLAQRIAGSFITLTRCAAR